MRVIFERWPQNFYETHGREATAAQEDQDTAKLKHRKLRICCNIQTPSRCRKHLESTGLKHPWLDENIHWQTNSPDSKLKSISLQIGMEPHCHLPQRNVIHITNQLQDAKESQPKWNYAADKKSIKEKWWGRSVERKWQILLLLTWPKFCQLQLHKTIL